MAVGSREARLTGAAEVPGRQADAASVGTAHIGRDVPHPLLGVICCHSNCATVNHLTAVGLAVVLTLRAGFALVIVGAAAVEISHQTVALSLIVTGVRAAAVILHLTGCTSEALRAFTYEAVDQGLAAPSVPTGTAGTAGPLNLTVPTLKPRLANTLVASGHLLAGPSILTLTMAAVHIDFTVLANPSRKAGTVISTNQVFARVSIVARLPRTLINVYLAGLARPLLRTEAFEAVLHVHAGPALSTGAGGTFVCVFSTGGPGPSCWTVTLKA